MAILSWERPDYLEICLDTLFQTNLYDYDITFLISDDGSIDPRVKEIIEKPRDAKYKIVRNYTPKGHNSWGAAFNKAMKKLLEIDDFDIVGTCDSDAVFHPEWLDVSMKTMVWAKANHKDHKLIKFSPFNSSNFEFHSILGVYDSPYGKYVVKERMGDVASFYFKKDLIKIGFYAEDKNDETLMTENFKKWQVRNFSTEQTYVDHIGQLSVLNQWRPTPVKVAVHGMFPPKEGWTVDLNDFRFQPAEYYEILETDYYRYTYQVAVVNNRGVIIKVVMMLRRILEHLLWLTVLTLHRWQDRLNARIKTRILQKEFDVPVDMEIVNSIGSSELKLDIIIPTISKDFDTLRFTLEGLRIHLKHPINKIKIIAPISEELAKFCTANGCELLDENKVLPISIKEVNYIAGGQNRSGWLFQQLLKFGGKAVSDQDNYLVVDADYIMTADRIFEKAGRFVLDASDEFHKVYFEVYAKLLGEGTVSPVSFVAHHMLINQQVLMELREHIEKISGKKWYEAIIEKADRKHYSGFSEYETYANYSLTHFPEKFCVEYWNNWEIMRDQIEDMEEVHDNIKSSHNRFKSITISNPLTIINLP